MGHSKYIYVQGDVREFKEHSIVFDDGSETEADLVILGTGYTIGYPFIQPPSLVPVHVSARVHDSLYASTHRIIACPYTSWCGRRVYSIRRWRLSALCRCRLRTHTHSRFAAVR
jgi:hypothetical protein